VTFIDFRAGHVTLDFTIPRPFDAYELLMKAMMPDNGAQLLEEGYKWEPIDELNRSQYRVMKYTPLFVRGLV